MEKKLEETRKWKEAVGQSAAAAALWKN